MGYRDALDDAHRARVTAEIQRAANTASMTLMVLTRREAHALQLFLRGDIGQGCRLHIRGKLVKVFQQGKAGQKKNQQNSHKRANSVAGIVENILNTRMN